MAWPDRGLQEDTTWHKGTEPLDYSPQTPCIWVCLWEPPISIARQNPDPHPVREAGRVDVPQLHSQAGKEMLQGTFFSHSPSLLFKRGCSKTKGGCHCSCPLPFHCGRCRPENNQRRTTSCHPETRSLQKALHSDKRV